MSNSVVREVATFLAVLAFATAFSFSFGVTRVFSLCSGASSPAPECTGTPKCEFQGGKSDCEKKEGQPGLLGKKCMVEGFPGTCCLPGQCMSDGTGTKDPKETAKEAGKEKGEGEKGGMPPMLPMIPMPMPKMSMPMPMMATVPNTDPCKEGEGSERSWSIARFFTTNCPPKTVTSTTTSTTTSTFGKLLDAAGQLGKLAIGPIRQILDSSGAGGSTSGPKVPLVASGDIVSISPVAGGGSGAGGNTPAVDAGAAFQPPPRSAATGFTGPSAGSGGSFSDGDTGTVFSVLRDVLSGLLSLLR